MIIQSPDVLKTIDDYDIVFENGMMMPLSLDKGLGDTINFGAEVINVNLVVKPSQNDPTKLLPAEDTTIYLKHVVSIQHRTRKVAELTPEEKHAWHKTWQELTTHPTLQ